MNMTRTLVQFAQVYSEALELVKRYNKSFWIIPTTDGYAISCFNEDNDLPEGTQTLEVTVDEVSDYNL